MKFFSMKFFLVWSFLPRSDECGTWNLSWEWDHQQNESFEQRTPIFFLWFVWIWRREKDRERETWISVVKFKVESHFSQSSLSFSLLVFFFFFVCVVCFERVLQEKRGKIWKIRHWDRGERKSREIGESMPNLL